MPMTKALHPFDVRDAEVAAQGARAVGGELDVEAGAVDHADGGAACDCGHGAKVDDGGASGAGVDAPVAGRGRGVGRRGSVPFCLRGE